MVRLKATKAYPYADKKLEPGDQFDANDSDAELLTKIGFAEYVTPKTKRQYHRRDMQAEP